MAWTIVSSNFGGETTVFGQRNEQQGGCQLYEVRTQYVIGAADEERVHEKPAVKGVVSYRHFAVAIDRDVNVFRHDSFLFCKSFPDVVDAIALCSDGGLLVVAERGGNLHIFTVEPAESVAAIPVPKAANDDGTALFLSVDVKRRGDDYVVCVLTAYHVITATISQAVIAQLASSDELDLSSLQIRFVDICHRLATENTTLSVVPLDAACLVDDDLLVTGGSGALCCVPDSLNSLAYGVLNDISGGKAQKMVVVDSQCTLLALTEHKHLVSICLKTFLIKDIWSEKMVDDFVLSEADVAESECGANQGCRIALLTAPSETLRRHLEIYTFPEFAVQYVLEVNELCHMLTFNDVLDDFWLVEGFADKEDVVTELRIRSVSEALPEHQLMKLVRKNKFEDAEKFARLFGLPLDDVHWHHLLYLLNRLGTTQQDVLQDETAKRSQVREVCNLIKVFPDVLQAAACCLETHIASPSVASELLLFLHGHMSSAQCSDSDERDRVRAQIASLLDRATTFRFLCDSHGGRDWFSFSQANLIQEMCGFFRSNDVSAGFLIWERHRDQLVRELNCEVVQYLLDAIPTGVEPSTLVKWLRGSFLPCIFESVPEALDCVCQWIVDRTVEMEVSHKSAWPSGALSLTKAVVDLFEAMSAKAECLPLHTWLAVYSAPKKIADTESAFCKLYHLLVDLQDLKVLWDKYKCRVSLKDLQSPEKEEAVFTILDEAMTGEQVTALLQGFLTQFMRRRGLDISQVLQNYVDQTFQYRPISPIHDEILEDKMVALVAFVDHPQCWLSAVRKILSHASVPWSETIEGLADQGSLLKGSAAEQIEHERKQMQVKVILKRHDVGLFGSVPLSSTSALVRCVLLSDKPDTLQDALAVAENLGDMSEADVFLFYLQKAFTKADIDGFAEAIQRVPHDILLILAPRLLPFAERLPQRSPPDSEEMATNLMECWQYLLNFLNEASRGSVDDYSAMHCLARQRMVLRRDFGIVLSTTNLCCENDKRRVLDQGFHKVLSAKCEHNPDQSKNVCRKVLYLAGILKLGAQSAIEVALASALELRREDIVELLCSRLLEERCIEESILLLLPRVFCECKDVLRLASKIYKIASRVALTCGGRCIKEAADIALWAHLLVQASLLLSGTEDSSVAASIACVSWEASFMQQRHGLGLDKDQVLMLLGALGRSVWSLLGNSQLSLFEDVQRHLLETCHYLCQRSQQELGLCVVAAVGQLLQGNLQQVSEQKGLEKFTVSQTTNNNAAILIRTSARKQISLPFVKALLCSLKPMKALGLLKQLAAQCNGNPKLLMHLAVVGSEVCSAQKVMYRSLLKGAYWCLKLAKFSISFADAMTNPSATTIQGVLQQMERSLLVDADDLLSYCSSFNLDSKASLIRRLECLMCFQSADLHTENVVFSQVLAKAASTLEQLPRTLAYKALLKILAKVDPYHYEVLQFGYDNLRALEEEPDSSVQREIDILCFLKSYRRYSCPSMIEMDQWCEKYPSAELSPFMQTRLPFHCLLQPTLWKFINDELYPETVDAWLDVSDLLRLDKDDVRFIAVENAILMWKSQKHKGNVLDVAFLSSVRRLVEQMNKKGKAIACLMGLLDKLPKGPTATRVAKECAALPDSFFAQDEMRTRLGDAKAKFTRKYIKLRNEEVLKQHGANSPSNVALCGKTADLAAALLQDSRWQVLFSDSSALYRCLSEIVHADEIIPGDLSGILDQSIKRWLGFQTPDTTADESALEFCFELNSSPVENRSAGLVTIVHLMQHVPDQVKEVLSCIASASDGFFGQKPRALALMCMLAGAGVQDPHHLGVPLPSDAATLEHIRVLGYKAKLQQLGLPLQLASLDADSAAEVTRAALYSHGHNATVLSVVSGLCIEYDVEVVSVWEAVLSAATTVGVPDIVSRVLSALGGRPLLWSNRAFLSAWQYVLQRAPTSLFGDPKEVFLLAVRCPIVQCLPPMLHEDDVCCSEESALCYFLYMLLRDSESVECSVKKLLTCIPEKSVKLLVANKGELSILKLAKIEEALLS
ncbi:hypothetical protein HPB48_006269 [Haemaphysalis longicornis]|uniref:RZZ complex subunit KNTC1/ROD C-terminal domain-containing protein n=1 Tax=Haemaphysalis longicornis TaxID=44386 RepID=A0A9J6G7V7_HAELO|nr:hypothetical protein HPB48_006269 [Haemaphysalis longicornis]